MQEKKYTTQFIQTGFEKLTIRDVYDIIILCILWVQYTTSLKEGI
jgi:hypothetical protein